jgi:AraC family transcriptional regulator
MITASQSNRLGQASREVIGTCRHHSGRTATERCLNHADEGDPNGRCQRLHIEKTRCWGSISAEIVNRAAGEVVWQSGYHRTVYPFTELLGTIRSGDGPIQDLRLERGGFAFRPSGVTLRSTLSGPARFVRILQSPDTYERIVSDVVRGGALHFEPRAVAHDPLISQIVLTIANEIEAGFFDYILADALNTALAVQIVRRCAGSSALMLSPANGLSRERLQRVRDYIESHMEDRLTLADLAGVACLSPYHFSRSFKLAMGVGPRRYVMRRRIDRAKTLMRRTNLPLASIAVEVGFNDQSHLTSIFHRETGMTPGRFRTALS